MNLTIEELMFLLGHIDERITWLNQHPENKHLNDKQKMWTKIRKKIEKISK